MYYSIKHHAMSRLLPVIIFCALCVPLVLAETGTDDANRLRLTCAGMGFEHGYLDGYEIGVNDLRYNSVTDVTAHPLYKNGDRGFVEHWTYRVVYQHAYRRGMSEGYEDAYRQRENLVLKRFAQLEEAILEANLEPPRTEQPSRPPAGTVVVPAGTLLLLQLDDYLTTKMNERGDPFSAVVARDLFVGNEIAIPAGTIIKGTVGEVIRPGKVSGRAEMNLRFNQLAFKTGLQQAFSATLTGVGQSTGQVKNAEGTYQEGDSKARDAGIITATAGTGAVVGAIAAGGRGGLIGATVGGLVGLAGVLTSRGRDIELVKGTLLEVMVDQDLRVEK